MTDKKHEIVTLTYDQFTKSSPIRKSVLATAMLVDMSGAKCLSDEGGVLENLGFKIDGSSIPLCSGRTFEKFIYDLLPRTDQILMDYLVFKGEITLIDSTLTTTGIRDSIGQSTKVRYPKIRVD